MSDNSARHAGTAGLCAFVLGSAAAVIGGVTPDASVTTEALRSYAHDGRGAILLTFALFEISVPFIFVFAAGLARATSGADGETAALAWGGFAGNIGLQCVAIAAAIPFVAAVWRGADDAVLRLTYDGQLLALYALTAGLSIASVVPTTIAGIITKVLPWWLALFAAAVALGNVAELAGLLFYDNGPMALGAAPGMFVAVPAWLLWLGATSIVLLRRRG